MIEAPLQKQDIPTLPGKLEMVRDSALTGIRSGDTDAFQEALTDVFMGKPFESASPDIAIVDLIAYAGAAFAAGDLYRSQGDGDTAGLYQAIGQHLLGAELDTLGMCMAAGISLGGIPVH
jgi:hypothetical protein